MAPDESEELADIVRSADDAVIAARLDATVFFCNAAAQRLYGYTPQEISGESLSLIVEGEHRHEWEAWIDQVRSGAPVASRPAVHRTKAGADIEVTVTLSPVRNGDGRITGVSVISRDNAHQKAWAAAVDATLAQTEGALGDC